MLAPRDERSRRAPLHPSADAGGTPIGAKLRSTRIAQGLTLAQVAEASGLSKGFLSRLERDETSPSVATLVQLCQVLSLPVGALFAEPEIQHIRRGDAPASTSAACTSRSTSCRRAARSACSCSDPRSSRAPTAAPTSTPSTATSRSCT
ncbi:hypothetical protein GCM10025870_10550 [Agromyces marinus]|uniref:HTH cro/C1-type domain-containing protein n=1 Tax=Agromyces marinus TaxID=1389020 RepID=A0ABN6Y9D7_9MICO|nr:hypothetical protein GCM10025870_10550 [Agromyces marinus]